ncbi:MAG: hypothetical protein IGS23_05405 [Rivularia sp. T60_A2020_040]|nr:hypothetical protein [Rivularia sp. T60_A2020_040]
MSHTRSPSEMWGKAIAAILFIFNTNFVGTNKLNRWHEKCAVTFDT